MLIPVSDSIIDKEETPKESGNYAGQEELINENSGNYRQAQGLARTLH